MDCRCCKHWYSCPCGKSGHDRGTSVGYSSGVCTEWEESKLRTYIELIKEGVTPWSRFTIFLRIVWNSIPRRRLYWRNGKRYD